MRSLYLDLPNDVKFLLSQKLLFFWGTCIYFFLPPSVFGFGPFWGTWTFHNGDDKNLKRRNFPSKKSNFPSKKRKNKSGWQAFPSSQNPKHETALFLEKSKKYTKQPQKLLFQLRAIISHNRNFQVYLIGGLGFWFRFLGKGLGSSGVPRFESQTTGPQTTHLPLVEYSPPLVQFVQVLGWENTFGIGVP